MNIRDIQRGRARIRLGASQEIVGKFFRGGVTRERIRQIEASSELSEAVVRDYGAALAKIISIVSDFRAAIRGARKGKMA